MFRSKSLSGKNIIMSGAEPFFSPGNRKGVLLVHGFTGTPHEMRLLGDNLAAKGYTVLGIRLTGHGTSMDDLVRCRWHDWLADIESGLALLKESTDEQFVVGFSMGAALSLLAASRYDFRAVAAVSAPAYHSPAWQIPLIPILGWFVKGIRKGKPDWNDTVQLGKHVSYPLYPVKAVAQYIKVLEQMRAGLSQIKMPVMLVQSSKDRTVPKDSLDVLKQCLTGTNARTYWVHDSNHMVLLEPDREAVFNLISDFLEETNGINHESTNIADIHSGRP